MHGKLIPVFEKKYMANNIQTINKVMLGNG
jgi:hypothetical protein